MPRALPPLTVVIVLNLIGCTASGPTGSAAPSMATGRGVDAADHLIDPVKATTEPVPGVMSAHGGLGIPGLTVRLQRLEEMGVDARELADAPAHGPADEGTVLVANRQGFIPTRGLDRGIYDVFVEAGVNTDYETRKFEGTGHVREPFDPVYLGTIALGGDRDCLIHRGEPDAVPGDGWRFPRVSIGTADGPAPLYVVCSALDHAGDPVPLLPTDVHASAIVETPGEAAIPPRLVGPIGHLEGRRQRRAAAWVLRLDGRFEHSIDVEGAGQPRLDVKRVEAHPDGGVLDVRIDPTEPGPLGSLQFDAGGAMAWIAVRHDASGMSRWAGSVAPKMDPDMAALEVTPGEVTIIVLSLVHAENERAIQPYHELGEEEATLRLTVREGVLHDVLIDALGRPSLKGD